jgi:hypothetical protein
MSSPNTSARPVVVYIMAFTSEQMAASVLQGLARLAQQQLSAKDPVFQQRFADALAIKGRIEISQQLFSPMMHTPQTMQTTLMGWLKEQYDAVFVPTVGENFFPHGMRDPQGKPDFVLFYFP